MAGHADQPMAMRELPVAQAAIWIAATFDILFTAIWLTGFVVPVRWRLSGNS